MHRDIAINAEKGEILIQNANGDKAIIPTHLRAKVEQMIAEGCHGCIDRLVSTLPVIDSSPGAKRAAEGAVVSANGKGGPKKGTTVFIATEAKPIPTYFIEDPPENLPKKLRPYQDEYYTLQGAMNSLTGDIMKAQTNNEIDAILNKRNALQEKQAEIVDKFDASEFNPLVKDDYFNGDGSTLESKLKEYYPDAKIVRKGVYGEEFGGLLKDMKKAKDRGDELITVFVNHADNRTNKIFGRSEEEVYGKVAELGSNIYCANCQDETQPEVLKKVTYGVDAYYPDFIKSNDDSHRTWGGVNSSAKKGKDINETLQRLLYTIHDNTRENDYDTIYTKGSPLFKKTEAIRPNRVVGEIDPLSLPPINQITGNPRKFADGGFTGNIDPKKFRKLSNEKTQSNKNLSWVARQLKPNPIGFRAKNKNGEMENVSHRLAAEVDENGNWYVFPTVDYNPKTKKWIEFDDNFKAMDYFRDKGELMNFGKDAEFAIAYSENGLIDHTKKSNSPVQEAELQRIANWYQSRLTGVSSNPMMVQALAREVQTKNNKLQNLLNLR